MGLSDFHIRLMNADIEISSFMEGGDYKSKKYKKNDNNIEISGSIEDLLGYGFISTLEESDGRTSKNTAHFLEMNISQSDNKEHLTRKTWTGLFDNTFYIQTYVTRDEFNYIKDIVQNPYVYLSLYFTIYKDSEAGWDFRVPDNVTAEYIKDEDGISGIIIKDKLPEVSTSVRLTAKKRIKIDEREWLKPDLKNQANMVDKPININNNLKNDQRDKNSYKLQFSIIIILLLLILIKV